MNGNNPRSNVNTNIGFRSALVLFVLCSEVTAKEDTKTKGVHFPADKAKDTSPAKLPVEQSRVGWPFLKEKALLFTQAWQPERIADPRIVTRGAFLLKAKE